MQIYQTYNNRTTNTEAYFNVSFYYLKSQKI